MVSYDFYVNTYLGSEMGEKQFSSMAAQAEAVLARFERLYRVSGGELSRAMAVCAMAECLNEHQKRRGGVTSASVGSVSVRYDGTDPRALERELYRQAAIYLDIYRGVG